MSLAVGYDFLREDSIAVQPLVNFYFEELLSGIKRRLSKHPSKINPWKTSSTVTIPLLIFKKFYRALSEHRVQNFREIFVSKKRDGSTKEIRIVFKHFGTTRFHLGKSIGYNFESTEEKEKFDGKYFAKTWNDNSKARVVVTAENPGTLIYSARTKKMTLTLDYQVTNQYGNVCF